MSAHQLRRVLCVAAVSISAAPALATTTYMSGVHNVTRLEVASGDQIVATANLPIICAQDAAVYGLISAEAGVSVEIEAATEVYVRGEVSGGDGASTYAVLGNGQNGGSVTLKGPVVILDHATLRGGDGGNAGRAGDGGDGGDVVIDVCDWHFELGDVDIEAGDAGRAGDGIAGYSAEAMNGGDGGDGGGIIIDCMGDAPGDDPPGDCEYVDGAAGWPGTSRVGKPGTDAGDGHDGTLLQQDGGHGGTGGKCGTGTGGTGTKGGEGSSCCGDTPGVGGDGGAGGTGGNGTGGRGGKGGDGGDGYTPNGYPIIYTGAGGDGGDGGEGGDAEAGDGGKGGKGGDGIQPGVGGPGGSAGTATPGTGGSGGNGGVGAPDGEDGDDGQPGTGDPGDPGDSGLNGDPC